MVNHQAVVPVETTVADMQAVVPVVAVSVVVVVMVEAQEQPVAELSV